MVLNPNRTYGLVYGTKSHGWQRFLASEYTNTVRHDVERYPGLLVASLSLISRVLL